MDLFVDGRGQNVLRATFDVATTWPEAASERPQADLRSGPADCSGCLLGI